MKKLIKLSSILLPIVSTTIPSIVAISSCSRPTVGYLAIPTDYLNITSDNTLSGFKPDKVECGDQLAKYDTLQVPSNVVKVSNFNYKLGYTSFNAIKTILGDNSGKWTTISDNAFSALPELTKIVLPKTITSIGVKAFIDCPKLNTIDLSNIQDISIIKSNCFNAIDVSEVVTNGTIIVKDDNDKTIIGNTFKDNNWLKGWSIKVK